MLAEYWQSACMFFFFKSNLSELLDNRYISYTVNFKYNPEREGHGSAACSLFSLASKRLLQAHGATQVFQDYSEGVSAQMGFWSSCFYTSIKSTKENLLV